MTNQIQRTGGRFRQQIAGRRRGLSMADAASVRERRFTERQSLPLVLEPAGADVDLIAWAASQQERLTDLLLENGGLLFRGFNLSQVEECERFIRTFSEDVLNYTYRSTPRSEVSGKIYTSTEYPADQSIPMHNEMSYSQSWPRKIWFFSLRVAPTGGETPIADSRKVFQQLDVKIRDTFIAKGVMYQRNYGSGVDLPWQNVFQTENRIEVEEFCRKSGIEFEWRGHDELQTRQRCHAVAVHPQTGEDLWFNQAHLFHISSHDPKLQDFLIKEFGEEGLPRNAYYGDGSPIDEEFLNHVREVYERNQIIFPWQKGDVLMLDNMLVAHGRRPYTGDRKVVVGMAEAWSEH